jgi:hypothetical protein
LAVTERRGYVLTWFFAAPHDSELQPLTDERVIFDSAPSIKAASATEPGGGTAMSASDNAPPAATSTAQQPEPASPVASATPTNAAAANSASAPAGNQQQSSNASSTKPTLLRPGETMDSQQGKGVRIPNKQKQSD